MLTHKRQTHAVQALADKKALFSIENKSETPQVSNLKAHIMLLTGHEEIFAVPFSSDETSGFEGRIGR